MSSNEIISLVITLVGLISFATLFTFLYRSFAKSSIAEINDGKRDIDLVKTIADEEGIKKKQKTKKIVKNVIFYLLLAILIPVLIFSLVDRISGNVTMVGGKANITVASGSMSYKNEGNSFVNDENLCQNYVMDNQFKKYDIITIKKVDSPDDINLYDVIAFRTKDGKNVIHRVVNIIDNNGKITYVTQGDALPSEDGLRPSYDDVIGVYTNHKINGLGIVILFCQSSAGLITILSLIYCVSMLENINNKISNAEKERVKKIKDVLNYQNDSDAITTTFYEEINYKGYAYRFNDQGFVDKRPVEIKEEVKSLETTEENKEQPLEREKKDD